MTYYRFSIRDLLWTMVVVGLALGWYLDRKRLTKHLAKVPDAIAAWEYASSTGTDAARNAHAREITVIYSDETVETYRFPPY